MSVPQKILGEVQFLSNQINSSQPLTSQPKSLVTAMQLNAANLVKDIDAAQGDAIGQLDTWVQPGDPFALISSLQGLGISATDQLSIFDTRSFVGRLASNLDQLP